MDGLTKCSEILTPGVRGAMLLAIVLSAVFIRGDAVAAPTTARLVHVDGTDVRTAEIEIVRGLIESDLIEHPAIHLLSYDDLATAEIEIFASLTRLGESYLVILSAQFEDGEQRSRKHKVANFDEIDVATERLVASLLEDVEFFATVARGAVLEDEQQPEAVVESSLGFELGFGPAWPISNSLKDHGTMYGFHGAVVWDIRDFLVDLRTDFQFGNDSVDTFAFTTTIGGRYVWHGARRYGIYSGIETGYGFLVANQRGNHRDRGAFLVGVNSGILLLRHADINLDLRIRLAMLTESLDGKLPVVLGMSLGLRF